MVDYVLTGLVKRRAELAGEMEQCSFEGGADCVGTFSVVPRRTKHVHRVRLCLVCIVVIQLYF
jgi:hypothetical protein